MHETPSIKPLSGRTVGVVEPRTTRLDLAGRGFALEHGGALNEVVVAYECCGALNAEKSNVIFICHALTGDAHVAGIRPGETEPSGWWEEMIGSGRAIDTDRFCVVCANVLGGCKGTTGPSSVNPETGRPHGPAFPQITMGDMVEVWRALARQLGIKRLAGVAGGSFGGMLALEWARRFPDEVAHALVIASAPRLNPQALAFDIIARQTITQDPEWAGGDYYGRGRGPVAGLASARKVAHVTYVSPVLLDEKFGRERRKEWTEHPDPAFHDDRQKNFGTYFQIESYLNYQGEKFVQRFDANSYLQITRAMDEYDMADPRRHASLADALAPLQCRTLVVSLSGDWLFTQEQSQELVAALLKAGKRVSHCHLHAPAGHDAFLTHTGELSRVIHAFLTPAAGQAAQPAGPDADADVILPLIARGSRVLDLGCGTGALLLRAARERDASGTGVEIDLASTMEGLSQGLDVLTQDLDGGLDMIPQGTYDTVVLSSTLQVIRRPHMLLRRLSDIGRQAVVAFPNFGYLPVRLALLFKGRMPKARALPYEWYDTPNIHLFTLRDFLALCKGEGWNVEVVAARASSRIGKILLRLGLRNLGADRVVVRLTPKASNN
ncbi:MAG: homoserine O-acetyltransferase [Kiritimatiellaeota bacterium]|nr:homoserine O-acetyltransferase [Kiritimatiellota bacterium]